MLVTGTTAPSYESLRPMKPRTSATFPVYPDLADVLAAPGAHPNTTTAHVLATCSGYAYSNDQTVAMIMARMGLEDNHCLQISESVDAMLIRATSFLVQSRDGRVVILCFRGTEPLDLINWMVDIDVNPGNVRLAFPNANKSFTVHGGFYRNVRAVRFEIIRALERALGAQSVLAGGAPMPHSLEALYVTGHSLGGAMAALMAIMLTTEPAYASIADTLRVAYTFGQPMVGDSELAAACQAHPFLGKSIVRYIYANDIIPQLPPAFAGDFSHFGPEYQYKDAHGNGRWERNAQPTRQLRRALRLLAAPLAILTRQIRSLRGVTFGASLEDHFPGHYVAALTPTGVQTEFGD